MNSDTSTPQKLRVGIAAVVVLSACLVLTTLALIGESVSVRDHLFQTGSIEINLNDGASVIQEHEFVFEPGMTVEKDFFVENEGSWDAYYKIYFSDVSGGLADVLLITVKDGDSVLYSGTAEELTRRNVSASANVLAAGERRDLKISFHFPATAGNEAQALGLEFTLCAEATQTKNNPDKLFE